MTRPARKTLDEVARLAALKHDELVARHDRAIDLLRRLVRRIEKAGGHSWPDEQADTRAAKALLAECVVVNGNGAHR